MSKSVTLSRSEAATGRKKKTPMRKRAGARKNHAAVLASDGTRARLAFTGLPSFAVVAGRAASDAFREVRSRRCRARAKFDRPICGRELLLHRARRPWLRFAPTRELSEWERRGRAAHEMRERSDCWRAK